MAAWVTSIQFKMLSTKMYIVNVYGLVFVFFVAQKVHRMTNHFRCKPQWPATTTKNGCVEMAIKLSIRLHRVSGLRLRSSMIEHQIIFFALMEYFFQLGAEWCLWCGSHQENTYSVEKTGQTTPEMKEAHAIDVVYTWANKLSSRFRIFLIRIVSAHIIIPCFLCTRLK